MKGMYMEEESGSGVFPVLRFFGFQRYVYLEL